MYIFFLNIKKYSWTDLYPINHSKTFFYSYDEICYRYMLYFCILSK